MAEATGTIRKTESRIITPIDDQVSRSFSQVTSPTSGIVASSPTAHCRKPRKAA